MSELRRTETPTEKAEREEIEKSLKVSTYISNDEFWESIHAGQAPRLPSVPNFRQPTKAEMLSLDHETQGINMDFEGVYKTSADNLSDDQLKTAMNDTYSHEGQPTFQNDNPSPPPPAPSRPKLTLSRNQASAIQKYPSLVEFLGKSGGEKIAKQITAHINTVIAEMVNFNSKEANDNAIICTAEKQNLKQYFKGEDWLCRVTASGPFIGDEAIYYSKDKDVACVLRKGTNKEGEVTYNDVSEQFNIIYELGEGEFSDFDTEASEKLAESTESEEEIPTEKVDDNVSIDESDSDEGDEK